MIDLTQTYRTRDGRAVTGLHIRPADDGSEDSRRAHPLRARVAGSGSYTFTAAGFWLTDGGDEPLDLIAVDAQPPLAAPAINNEATRSARSEALGHAVRLPGSRSAACIVKDAQAFYGFLTGAASA